MSDFVFSRKQLDPAKVGQMFDLVYNHDPIDVMVFSGGWGSLFVGKGYYRGYSPMETDQYVAFVIGAPLLAYDSHFEVMDDSDATRSLLDRWVSQQMVWDEDVDGPFVFVAIDKSTQSLTVVTDLGLYIPVYYTETDEVTLGTHVDMVAYVSEQLQHVDEVSLMDFYLNGCVTFPYTGYKRIKQCDPASLLSFHYHQGMTSSMYWFPRVEKTASDLDELAEKTRQSIQDYIDHVVSRKERVGLFLSGGEDSRLILSALEGKADISTYTFLDQMNREGKIAQAVAALYDVDFHYVQRDASHYLNILKQSSLLVGSGVEFKHCHAFGFFERIDLKGYQAFFGGYQADTMLKGYWLSSKRFLGLEKSSCVGSDKQFTQLYPFDLEWIQPDVLHEMKQRKIEYLKWNRRLCPQEVLDSYFLWPRTMGAGMVNFYCNRRLFASYEVFMNNQILKTVFSMPSSQRDGRKFYARMSKSYFRKSKWIQNANGTWPYLYLPVEKQLLFLEKARRKLVRMGLKGSVYQGSWCDWNQVFASDGWQALIQEYAAYQNPQFEVFKEPVREILQSNMISPYVKLNIIQSLVHTQTLNQLEIES